MRFGKKLKNHHLICSFFAKEGVLLNTSYNNKMYEWISLFSSEAEKSEKKSFGFIQEVHFELVVILRNWVQYSTLM